MYSLLGVTGEEDGGRAVGVENGHRIVVCLGEVLARRRCDDVLDNSTRRRVVLEAFGTQGGAAPMDRSSAAAKL
jgi:hypothetical protein